MFSLQSACQKVGWMLSLVGECDAIYESAAPYIADTRSVTLHSFPS